MNSAAALSILAASASASVAASATATASVLAGVNERTSAAIPVIVGLFVLFDVIGVILIVLVVRRRKGPEG